MEAWNEACGVEERAARERAVTLTNGQWSDLTTWLLLNERHADEVAESWERAVRKEVEGGSAARPSAVGDAEAWKGLNASVKEIRKAIDRV